MADVYAADVGGGWGVVTENLAGRSYYVAANLVLGDATEGNGAAFLSRAQVVAFAAGNIFTVTNHSTLTLGARYPDDSTGWGRFGSTWLVTMAATWNLIPTSATAAVFSMYGSTLTCCGDYTLVQRDGTWNARNAIIAGEYKTLADANQTTMKLNVKAAATIDWKQVQANNWHSVQFDGSTMTNFDGVHLHAGYYGIRAAEANSTVTTPRITDSYDDSVYMYGGAGVKTLTLVDPAYNIGGSADVTNQDANAIVAEVYTCNIHVVDADGVDLETVNVVCTDEAAAGVFDVNTDAGGDIAEQTITYKQWAGTSETETAYSPHTFVFTKAGYKALTMENVTVSRPINWRIELPIGGEIGAVPGMRSGGML